MDDNQRQQLRALCASIVESIDDPLADETEDWWMQAFWRDFFALRSLLNTVDRELSAAPSAGQAIEWGEPIEIAIGWELDLGGARAAE